MPSEASNTLREVSNAIDEAVSVVGMIQDPVGAVTGMLEDKANQVLANATNFISQALPSFPAAFLGSLAIGLPHAHIAHPPSGPPPVPPTPLPPIGVVALGTCISVMINGIPAARSGDVGFNPTCCGLPPMFDIFTGSSKVFIGGKRAARMIDITVHCKPGEGGAAAAGGGALATMSKVATAAAVGADAMDAVEGDPAAQARLAVMAAQAAADAVANALKASMGMDPCVPPGTMGMVMLGAPNVLIGGFPMPSWSAIAKGFQKLLKGLKRQSKPSNKGCGKPGEPVDVVTGANVDDFTDYEISEPLGFQWRRFYSSAFCDFSGPMGHGFRHEYQRELHHDLDGFRYVDPEGVVTAFPSLSADGDEEAKEGLVLRRVDPHVYLIEEFGGSTMEFIFDDPNLISPARLHRLHLSEGIQELRYDSGKGWLTSIATLQWRIDVHYDELGHICQLVRRDAFPAGTAAVAVYEYDNQGCLIGWTDALGHRSSYQYDATLRMTRKTDRRDYSFNYRYDSLGRCIHTYGDDGLYDVRLKYLVPGHCTIATFSDGGDWAYLFDQNGTITEVVDPYGGKLQRRVGPDGQVAEEVDAGGSSTRLLYTGEGAHYARRNPLGYLAPPLDIDPDPPAPLAHELPETPFEWEFGQFGAQSLSDEPTAEDPLLALSAPLAQRVQQLLSAQPWAHERAELRTVQHRDSMGRLIEQVGKDGRAQRWKYDENGNVLSYQDQDGSVYQNKYYSWNLLGSEIDPLGHVRSYRYSPTEEITQVVDPGGTTSEYVYDKKDRLVEVHRHGRLRERYLYDKADNLVLKLDGAGKPLLSFQIANNNLDSSERLTSGEIRRFEYDRKGRITRAATSENETRCAYDDLGRRLFDERNGRGVSYDYARDAQVRTTLFDRFVTSYHSERWGELRIQDPTGGAHLFQRSRGLISKSLADGTLELAQYDREGRCLFKIRQHQFAALWHCSYHYSREGDLLYAEDSIRGTTQYLYDAAHRLIEERTPAGEVRTYRYDPAGNLLQQPGLSGVGLAVGNKLLFANGARFLYDDRDHLCLREDASGTTRYVYDSDDMLVCCETQQGLWSASYDPLGRRTRKKWPEGQVDYYWDGDRLAAEERADGRLRIYIYADENALVPFMFVDYKTVDTPADSGSQYYVFTNQIGVPLYIEDAQGAEVWSATIDPYGQAHVCLTSSLDFAFRFPGHYHDEETGLHYNRFRYYSPELGRYLQSDPLGIAGGLNLYAYPANPLTYVDIQGEHGKSGKRHKNNQGKNERRSKQERTRKRKNQKKSRPDRALEAAQAKAARLKAEAEKNGDTLPTCTAAVRDKKTGKIYYATSGPPPLKHSNAEKGLGMPTKSKEQWPPGNCAEPKAINEALKNGAKKENLQVASVNTADGSPKQCCRNCVSTTKGTTVSPASKKRG